MTVRKAIAGTPHVGRRHLLAGAAGLLALSQVPATAARAAAKIPYPFTLGIASGDPAADSVVLWTRLAADPLAADGGMPAEPVRVEWQIATDERMRAVVCSGTTLAVPGLGHSVHVEAGRLAPGRDYWYRFRVAGHVSPTGRTRTLPAATARPSGLLLAVASCQNFQTGYYTAYRSVTADHPDLVLFLGDYIYEYPPGQRGSLPQRQHLGPPEPADLAGYRIRYGQYKSDPDLQGVHAAAPFVCTWDDHEVDNDYAGDSPVDWAGGGSAPPTTDPDSAFHLRRAAAYQAFYEHLPLRHPGPLADWADLRLYRRFRAGDLATFHVLDTRRYRDNQPCDEPHGNLQVGEDCAERDDPGRSILGTAQRSWLLDGLDGARRRWDIVAQQVLFAELDQLVGPGRVFEVDGWDGYTADRQRILRRLHDTAHPGAVVLSGDLHTHFVNDLRLDFRDAASPTVATEFVTTAISSPTFGDQSRLLPDNPHVRFTSNRNGYLRVRLDRETLRAELRSMRNPGEGRNVLPESECYTDATFVVRHGSPGAEPA